MTQRARTVALLSAICLAALVAVGVLVLLRAALMMTLQLIRQTTRRPIN